MKIVHVIDFFHPNAGYQLNVLSKYIVKMGHEDYIVTGKIDKINKTLLDFFGRENIEENDKIFEMNTGVKIIRLPLIAYYSGRAIFSKKLEQTVENLKPDVLFIHDIDTLVGIKYVFKAKGLKYPVVFNSTMLEMASANRFRKQYRWFFNNFITPKIIKNRFKIIRIQDDDYLERCLGIPLNQCPFISVGSDTMLFHPDDFVKQKFRTENGISTNDFVVIYTGKLVESKGAKLLAEAFEKKFQIKSKRNIVLMVVGNSSGEYGQEVEEIFNRSENRIMRFTTQKYLDLAKFYQVADLSIFPKECSLSFYDAQACGLPVLSEDNNVNVDRLKYNNGFNFKKGSLEDLRDKLIMCVEIENEKYNKIRENAITFVKENYDYNNIAKMYIDILVEEYKQFNKKSSK